jgi:competence protein ComEA
METPLSPFTFTPKPDWFEQYKYYLLGILLVIFAVGLYLILTPPKSTLGDGEDVKVAGASNATIASVSETNGQIVVDIAGGVMKSGIYWLKSGSIIEDAIKSAGGFSRSADLDAVGKNINRAQELANHGKVYIPKIGDANIVYSNSSSNSSANPLTSSPASLININTANNAELDLLPGIGPILSQRIIDYRLQNNNFKSIDDLQNVPGIGDKLFEQLKPLVTI